MGPKWPFMLLVLSILFVLGYTIVSLERTTVLKNWVARRCDLPVMTAAAFFKPESDPRSTTAFAVDNFEFCMKSYIDSFMNIFMAPVNAIFGQHLNIAGVALDGVSTIRTIAQRLYNAFAAYLDQYFRRFHSTIFEISRMIQYLRMAVNRSIAVAVSTIYAGIAMFRTMLNAVQFVIKVVLIVCTILLILIIILFFVLFPAIPVVLGTLAAIISIVIALSTIMPGSIASDANDKKTGFCFSQSTPVLVKNKNGAIDKKMVEDLCIGDELAENCGKVTAVIKMSGTGIQLYNLNGVYLSGTHLVKGLDGIWKSVSNDVRAVHTDKESPILYCFNTTSNNIPVHTDNGVLLCRDWEEIGNEDQKGQYIWNYLVSQILNTNSNYVSWKDNVRTYVNVAVIGKDTLVKTPNGFIPVKDMELYDVILSADGKEQCVYGTVTAEIENACNTSNLQTWKTELYEWRDNVWIKGKSTLCSGNDTIEGLTLITETGDFIIWDEELKKEIAIRDFTEIGYHSIHQTYSFVEARLRITEPLH